MTELTALLPSEGRAHLAREYIPSSHRHFPMVRLLLPLFADQVQVVRWSEYVSLHDELATLSWWQVVDRVQQEHPEIADLVPCRGELDAETAAALQDATGDLELTSLRWTAYEEPPGSGAPVRVYGNEFFPARLQREDLQVGMQVPEFAWDDHGSFAWGTVLYPDSLIVAGELHRLRRLHADSRVDTIVVRPDADVLPPTSGDG